jgi:hypothetical protein
MTDDVASPWPRHARLWSVLILVAAVVMGAGGVLAALGRSTTEGLLGVGGLVAIALLGADRASTGSTVFGLALLLVGAALFFLPGRQRRE